MACETVACIKSTAEITESSIITIRLVICHVTAGEDSSNDVCGTNI